jgi:predicted nucleic acid-binding protein
VEAFVSTVRAFVTVEPVTLATHELGLSLAERYGFSVWDAMIVAAGLLAGCGELLSEDMQDGLVVAGEMRVVNPFG